MSTAAWAARYCEIGMALTWTAPGRKGPRHAKWNSPDTAITAPAAARRHWSLNPAQGIAALLGFSHLVSLDIDDEVRSRTVLGHFGIDLDELRSSAPCIVGRGFRLMFKAPAVDLKHRTLAWPKPDGLIGGDVLLELRAGCIADTLPPSVHAGTGQPYRWENPPRNGFPPLPGRLLELWIGWTQTMRAALALCPSASAPREVAPVRSTRVSTVGRASVIQQFNLAHDTGSILRAHGYSQRGKRFTSPDCQHAAGVVLLETGRIFCHHQGDVLSGEHAHDAFDLFRILEHGGDARAAVRHAAVTLGLNARTE